MFGYSGILIFDLLLQSTLLFFQVDNFFYCCRFACLAGGCAFGCCCFQLDFFQAIYQVIFFLAALFKSLFQFADAAF